MTDAPDNLLFKRRRFLKLCLGLSCASATLLIPTRLLAASKDPIAKKLEETKKEKLPTKSILPEKKPRAPRLLMIDPGHGGHDPGAIGINGTQEKDITLDIARRMMNLFDAEQSVNAKLTRSTDVFLPLPQRVKLAESAHADMFISLHADSAPNKSARGLSAYTLSEKASDDFANALATQENRIEAMGGVDLSQTDKEVAAILVDLTARRTRNTSQRAKVGFVQSMGKSWGLLERPMRSANFAVLRAPDVPSILVEMGFLSNPQDEKLLNQSTSRQKIASLMVKELTAILDSPLFG